MDSDSWAELFQRAQSQTVDYQKDAQIVCDGLSSDFIYRVVSGTVRVEKSKRSIQDHEGSGPAPSAMVATLQEGNTFGEMSFLDNQSPCATCIADTSVQAMRISKTALQQVLAQDPQLSCKFYRQMAIAVAQRLQHVSKASADIREAPRGISNYMENPALPLSAKKLLKVRHRLGVADTETMACMMQTSMLTPAKRKSHGTVYVFETMIGFVSKVFGIKQHETINFCHVSEVVRETFTLKREDNAVEVILEGKRSYIFQPQSADDAFDAMQRCLQQYKKEHAHTPVARRPMLEPAAFSQNPHMLRRTSSVEETFRPLIEKATLERYKAGDVIIAEGSQPLTLFNIAKGRVAVEVQRLNEETQVMQAVKILTLYEPAMFGEMSFLKGDVACASVVAEVETEVWQIKGGTIEATLSEENALQQISFYKHLASYLAARVRQLTAMVAENYAARDGNLPLQEVLGNAVFFALFKRFLTERKLVDNQLLFFLQELNEFLSVPANENLLRLARKLYSKYLVGPHALHIEEHVRADIAALLASETLPPRDIFAPVLSQVLEMLKANAFRLFRQSAAFQPLLDLKAKEKAVPTVDEFKLLQILGEGYEGKVLQVRKKDCGVMYALKVLDKAVLSSRSRRWQLHASRELECLIACDHPYIVGLSYAFQTPQYLYMVQEYVPNHTMAQYLEAYQGMPVKEPEVRFMVCELVLALAHMHSRRIVYRDLKPANVLIDDDGHLRMVDMGMASRLDADGRRKSICGTQRYMAPEMKEKKPYTISVDWYSLGKLILDFHGRTAYSEESSFWERSGLLELIDGLLVKDPLQRRGCGPDGVRQIQRSRFFHGVDWAAFEARKAPSPLQRSKYLREPDVTSSRQFRNGEDLGKVVEKLQHISLDTGTPCVGGSECEPGMVPNWDHVNARSVYNEYLHSPYHNAKAASGV